MGFNRTLCLLAMLVMSPAGAQTPSPSISQSPSQSVPPTLPPATLAPTINPENCFTNTTELFAVVEAKSPFIETTYILCPNTVFDIAVDFTFARDGERSLIAISNTIIQCGPNGDPRDNCILRGGAFSIDISPGQLLANSFRTINVVYRGLTLDGALTHGVFIANKGDVTFEDCIFRDMENRGPLFSIYTDFPEEFDDSPPPDVVVITVRRCLFENNRQGTFTETPVTALGVVHTVFPDRNVLIIEDSVFRGNIYLGGGPSEQGYAISALGPSLTLRRNCFYNNSFVGFGVIHAFNGLEIVTENNDFIGPDQGSLTCSYLARSALAFPDNVIDIECIESTASTCQAQGVLFDIGDIGDTTSFAQPVFFSQWCWIFMFGICFVLY